MVKLKEGFSIKDGWLVAETGVLGAVELTMRYVGGEGEQVEIYSPAGRQIITLSKLPRYVWPYLKALHDETEGEQS